MPLLLLGGGGFTDIVDGNDGFNSVCGTLVDTILRIEPTSCGIATRISVVWTGPAVWFSRLGTLTDLDSLRSSTHIN